jgi:hypothetical protein
LSDEGSFAPVFDEGEGVGKSAMALSLAAMPLALNIHSEEASIDLMRRNMETVERINAMHELTVLETNRTWARALVDKTRIECDSEVAMANIRSHTEIALANIGARTRTKEILGSLASTAICCSIAPSATCSDVDIDVEGSHGGWFSNTDYRVKVRIRRR